MYSITVHKVHKHGKKHSIYVHLYCTCNINKTVKQGKYMSQEKRIKGYRNRGIKTILIDV